MPTPAPTLPTPTQLECVQALRNKAAEVSRMSYGNRTAGWSDQEWDLIVDDYRKYSNYLNDLATAIESRSDNRQNIIARGRAMPYVPVEFWQFYGIPVP